VEAERRQVTVLFADMVGFTAFSERSGEEAAFTLMQSLAALMEDAVREQGGVVQGFTGDGIMAVFGAPVAHEDAPLRACRAAMAILEKVKAAGADLEARHGVWPQLRIGLNSGPAVVGKVQGGADADVTVLGDTVNVAARLQALAEPGSAIMSDAMHRPVEGLVEAGFVGEHQIRGKSDAQKAYRLDRIHERATRFDFKVQRGLTRYVGRQREMETLERAFRAIGDGIQVFDIVGEPGIGKSRLVHEFLGKVVQERARALTGSCTPDGHQTPFRAFIEIVRGAFRLSPNDGDAVVARKLDEGLQALGLRNQENLGLLLNLLGLRPPQGALEGLDGVLIGLRTHALLQRLAQARSQRTPTILVVEDLHWLDSASEDLLAKIVAFDQPFQLLILHTRRPEYSPPWADRPRVTHFPMEPLSARETARIAEARLGVDHLPEPLAKLIATKAEGNALFAEEIALFLVERGVVRRNAAGLDFDPGAVAAALPESLQTLLASRVDRLAPSDRNLLQTAAVIGRRFDPDLVAVVGGARESAGASFAAMEALNLIRRAEGSTEYEFKHVLVRDALYGTLLSGTIATLHLKVAEELERRCGSRLMEFAETLAYHYAATARTDKAFTYLAMAGDKSLDIYSIAEAEIYYRRALAIFEAQNTCFDRMSVAHVVVRLLETLANKNAFQEVENIAAKFMSVVREAGESPELVVAYFYQAMSLHQRLNIRKAHELAVEGLAIAERLADGRARAYARGFQLFTGSFLTLYPIEIAEQMNIKLIDDVLRFGDGFINNFGYYFIAWDYFSRGLTKEARQIAMRLIASGEERKDPRAIGLANVVLGWTKVADDDPAAAIVHAEECERVGITPLDRFMGAAMKASSKILLGGAHDGLIEIEALNSAFEQSGALLTIQRAPQGVAYAMLGRLSEGIRIINKQIAQSETIGDHSRAAWGRVILAEIYIQILSGKEKLDTGVFLRNIWTIIGALLFGASRARALLRQATAVRTFSEKGVLMARLNFDLGVLSAMKKKRNEARGYLEKARVGAESQGADKLLQKIDSALAELQRSH
jgi:class 3 adenylate cyclase/tetratricopeptide (TPR) repeat protein